MYDLYYRYACAIDMGEKFVLTGGQGDNAEGPYGPSITRVTEYNINGFVKDLQEMMTPRFLHGCSHFTNKDNQNVFMDLVKFLSLILDL